MGAGYDYQWDVSVLLLLTAVLTPQRRVRGIDEDFDWLGPISGVHLEGDSARDALEDLTFHGVSGRHLHLQIKEREPDGTSRWKKRDEKLIEFMNRAAEYAGVPERRFSFLTNGVYDASVTKLLEAPKALAAYRDAEVAKHFAKHPEQIQSVERYERLGDTVRLRRFLDATELGPDRKPISGVAYLAIHRLYELGVRAPEETYGRLYLRVKDLSIQKGGSLLTVDEVRREILALLELSEADLARRRHVISLIGSLDDPQRAARGQFSLSDIRHGQLFSDEEEFQRAEEMLRRHRRLLVLGHRASGKTVFVGQLGVRAQQAGAFSALWDFENLGIDLPVQASDYLADVAAVANVNGTRPLLVLENVHLNPSAFQMVLTLMSSFPGMELLATARGDGALRAVLSDAQMRELEPATLHLERGASPRGERVLLWHLTQKRKLSGNELRRVYASVSWSDYVGDLIVLDGVLKAYDWASYSLPAWAVHARLQEMLQPMLRESSGADDLLYLLAALGRSGVSLDYRAAARILGRSEDELRRLVLLLSDDGLIVLEAGQSLVRFWHQSIAQLFWELFRIERGELARGARQVLRLEEA